MKPATDLRLMTTLAIALIIVVSAPSAFAQQEYPNRRFPVLFSENKGPSNFGINVGPWWMPDYEKNDTRVAWDFTFWAGLKWVKLSHWANKGCWDWVELMPGEYHFHDDIIGANIDDAIAHGMQVVFNLAYGNSLYGKHPEWEDGICVEDPSHQDMGPCTRLYVPTDEAVFKSFSCGFARYCQEMVKHYGDRVKHWEVWCEPNYGSCDRTDVNFWSPHPNPAQYAYLLFEAANAIKSVDESAKVSFAGLVGMDKAFLGRCFDILNSMGGEIGEPEWVCNNIDIIGIDPFRHEKTGRLSAQNRPEKPTPVVNDDTMDNAWCERHLSEFATYEEQMADFKNFLKPYFECRAEPEVWVLQDCWIYNMWGPEIQAKYLARTYIVNFALGIPVFWWQLKEGSELYAHDWGILNNRTSEPRPAYYSLQSVCAALDSSMTPYPLYHRFPDGDPGPVRFYSFASPTDVRIVIYRDIDADESTPETNPAQRYNLEIANPYDELPFQIWPVQMLTYPDFRVPEGRHPCVESQVSYEFTSSFRTIILKDIVIADYPVVISLGRAPTR
ncbi:MAG: hypothetical protein JW941_09950 [Candidatus Coatesbacteria bacterium]|nr:hypothetical protein [Candidatus Coatesbacteria bacterium]